MNDKLASISNEVLSVRYKMSEQVDKYTSIENELKKLEDEKVILSNRVEDLKHKLLELSEGVKDIKPIDYSGEISKLKEGNNKVLDAVNIKLEEVREGHKKDMLKLKEESLSSSVKFAEQTNKDLVPVIKGTISPMLARLNIPKGVEIKGGDNIIVTKKETATRATFTIHQDIVGDSKTVVVPRGSVSASVMNITPYGSITATSVQGAINQLDDNKVNRIGDSMSGTLSINPTGVTSGTVLLYLGIDRAWQFRQSSTGANAMLDINSLTDNKSVIITSPAGAQAVNINVNNTLANNLFFFNGRLRASSLGVSAVNGVSVNAVLAGSHTIPLVVNGVTYNVLAVP